MVLPFIGFSSFEIFPNTHTLGFELFSGTNYICVMHSQHSRAAQPIRIYSFWSTVALDDILYKQQWCDP